MLRKKCLAAAFLLPKKLDTLEEGTEREKTI
jgi:hypothetical protein